MRWTAVLETDRGSGVRADFRSTAKTNRRRLAWRQDIEGTPFEKILRESSVEIQLEPEDDGATKVRLHSEERLRGLARFGSVIVRRAAARRLDEALAGIDLVLVGEPA